MSVCGSHIKIHTEESSWTPMQKPLKCKEKVIKSILYFFKYYDLYGAFHLNFKVRISQFPIQQFLKSDFQL